MIVWKSAASIVGLAGAVLVGPAAPDQVQMASVVGVSAAAVVPDPYFEARFVPISPCRTLSINSAATTELSVKNYGGPTQLVIDVTGYYTKPLRAWVYQDGSVYPAVSSRLVSVNAVELGVYDVTFDRDLSTCTPLASVNHSEC